MEGGESDCDWLDGGLLVFPLRHPAVCPAWEGAQETFAGERTQGGMNTGRREHRAGVQGGRDGRGVEGLTLQPCPIGTALYPPTPKGLGGHMLKRGTAECCSILLFTAEEPLGRRQWGTCPQGRPACC